MTNAPIYIKTKSGKEMVIMGSRAVSSASAAA
jgi:hypothetical protein